MIGGEAMIEKDYNLYILVCDVCGEEKAFDSFDDAVETKKASWKSKAENGIWVDMCPECQEVE